MALEEYKESSPKITSIPLKKRNEKSMRLKFLLLNKFEKNLFCRFFFIIGVIFSPPL